VKLVFSAPEHTPALLASFTAETRKYAQAIDILTALVARTPLSFTGRTRWLIAEAARVEYAAHRQWLETVRRVLAPDARGSDGDVVGTTRSAPVVRAVPARDGERRAPLRAQVPPRDVRSLRDRA